MLQAMQGRHACIVDGDGHDWIGYSSLFGYMTIHRRQNHGGCSPPQYFFQLYSPSPKVGKAMSISLSTLCEREVERAMLCARLGKCPSI